MQHFLLIVTKRWKEILALMVITTAASVIFGLQYNKTSFSNTIFLTIGAKQESDQKISPYETLQAADHFAEAVQGWFKNPALIEKIREQSGIDVDFGARKQEKQNLVITFKAVNAEDFKKIAAAAKSVLLSEIATYNLQTGSEFSIPNYAVSSKESSLPIILFALGGLIAGAGIGFTLGSALEKLMSEIHQFAHSKK